MRIAAVIAVACFPVAVFSQAIVSTTPLGAVPANPNEKYYLSPDGGHVAVVKVVDGGMIVSIDGVDGERFDAVDDIVNIPVDGMLMEPRVVFSNNGKRFAYTARRGGTRFVVVDGKTYPAGRRFQFSPDGGHFAYIAGDPDGTQPGDSVVVDGKPGTHYDQIKKFQFSDDGKHLVYAAYGNGGQHVVFDGKAAASSGEVVDLKLAPRGQRYVYFRSENQKFIPVIDGVPQPEAAQDQGYVANPTILLSDDGKHWAWIACQKGAGRVFHDGVGGATHGTIEDLKLSPDGKRVAYVARTNNTRKAMQVLMVDGKQVGGEFYNILGLQFSPDSRRTAAFAGAKDGTLVLIDDQQLGPFVQKITDFTFSNSGRYFFIARPTRDKFAAFVDGKLDNESFDLLRDTVSFSPDGARLVYSGSINYPNRTTSIDGKNQSFGIENYWGPQTRLAAVWSPDSKHLAYNVLDGTSRNMFVDGNSGAEGLVYSMATFSPDGRHFAMAGSQVNGNGATLFVDGKALTTVDEVEWRAPSSWAFEPDGKLRVVAKKDGRFQRFVIDPQSGSLGSFSANMAKSGKISGPKSAEKGGAKQKPGGTTTASASSGDTKMQQAKNQIPDPEAEANSKVDEAGDKAKEAVDKGLKKLKGLFGDKKK